MEGNDEVSVPKNEEISGIEEKVKVDWRYEYGFRNERSALFTKFPPTKKPRVPRKEDREDWVGTMLPKSIDEFLGNEKAVEELRAIASGKGSFQSNYVITGDHESGKRSFLNLLKSSLVPERSDQERRIICLNVKAQGEKEVFERISQFLQKQGKEEKVAYVAIEKMECIGASAQQHLLLPLLLSCNARKIFFLMVVTPDLSKTAEQIKQRCFQIHLQPLTPLQILQKILTICTSQNIGFTQEAIEELLRLTQSTTVLSITKLQHVFLDYHYVSLSNVRKLFKTDAVVSDSFSSSGTFLSPEMIIEMSQPLKRCNVCTLFPPCKHISLAKLYEKMEEVRKLYPNSSKQCVSTMVLCPSFDRKGICSNIRSIGRCRYAHPLERRVLAPRYLIQRCRPHTLPLPCLHCNNLIEMKRKIKQEEDHCNQLEVFLLQKKKKLSEIGVERYLFIREQSKVVKWGAAKVQFQEKLHRIDSSMKELQLEVEEKDTQLKLCRKILAQLQHDVFRGHSKGLGKGNARPQSFHII